MIRLANGWKPVGIDWSSIVQPKSEFKTIGSILMDFRAGQNITIPELAGIMGYDASFIYSVETTDDWPTLGYLKGICDTFDLGRDILLMMVSLTLRTYFYHKRIKTY